MVKDARDWGKFVAKDLFGPSKLGKYHNPRTLHESDDGYEFICASVRNNGINQSMPKVDGENLSLTPPSIIAWGKQSPFFTYHENPCVTSQGMYFIEINDLTRNQINFVITVLNKLTSGYNYTNCLIGKKFDELSVPLPLKPGTDEVNYTQDDIDWDYMESYIHELEESYIHELDAYLKETGLDDYTLTDVEQELLEAEPTFKEFKVGDLFDCNTTKAFYPTKENLPEGKTPYISRTTSNNGVSGFYDDIHDKFTIHHQCITVGAETGIAFWQEKPFIPGVKVYTITHKQLNSKNALFITTLLNKSANNYGFTYLRTLKKIKAEIIQLPVKPGTDEVNYTEDDIDWDYMAAYIRAMEKQVITDVVDYKDSMITTAKELVYV